MKTLSALILLLIIMTSCSDEQIIPQYSVPKIFEVHVNEFFKQAELRGFHYDRSNLTITIESIGNEIAGQSNIKLHTMKIDTATYAWKRTPEVLIFHELGHIFLARGHDNAMLDIYHDKSIMNAIIMNGYTASNPLSLNPDTRTYYINELFNPNEPKPTWIN